MFNFNVRNIAIVVVLAAVVFSAAGMNTAKEVGTTGVNNLQQGYDRTANEMKEYGI
jgi:hypothetical protein